MKTKTMNATQIAEKFSVTKYQINPILSELGFIKKCEKGWELTELGKRSGGIQKFNQKADIHYVVWGKEIMENKALKEGFASFLKTDTEFRQKFKAEFRAADGHYVRSKAEMLLDNWLYMSGIVHAYERQLPVEEEVYCDFYLPHGKVYIEYWGLEEDERYKKRKEEKIKIYQKYKFNLIELNEKDIQNIDDILPKQLLKFGLQAL